MKLTESINFAEATVEDGLIKGIKILGERSKNNRTYPLSTRTKAHKMLEGCVVNINHDNKNHEGSVQNRFGKICNVREGANGTIGDLRYLTSHPFADQFKETAQTMPELMGFSIHAIGKMVNKNGENIVENIERVNSVDVVANPGTNKSIFESAEEPETKSCEQLIGELVAALVAEGKEDAVKDVIKLKKKICGDGADKEEEDNDKDEPAEESWKQEYKVLKAEKHCRELCESHQIKPEAELMETLVQLDDEGKTKFLAWHKKNKSIKNPRSGGGRIDIAPVETVKNWASILRSNKQ